MRKLVSHYAVHDLNVAVRLLQEETIVNTLDIATFSDHTMLFENIIVVQMYCSLIAKTSERRSVR